MAIINTDVEIEVECSECGLSLTTRTRNNTIMVNLCESCSEKIREDAYNKSYEQARKEYEA